MAIVYVSGTSDQATTATSITFSSFEVAAGTDKALYVSVSVRQSATEVVSSVVFNTSEDFSLVATEGIAGQRVEIWELLNPTATTADIVVTLDGAPVGWAAGVVNLTGVHQTGGAQATSGNTSTGTAVSDSVTTLYDNSLIINGLHVKAANDTATVDSPLTERWNEVVGAITIGAAGTRTTTTKGSYTCAWTIALGNNWSTLLVEIMASTESLPAYPAYKDNGGIAAGGDVGVDVPYPSTIDADDILVIVMLDADNDVFTIPTGDTTWYRIHADSANSNLSYDTFWTRALGSETGTITVNSDLTAGSLVAGIMYRFSGCITGGTPFEISQEDVASQAASNSRTLSPTDTLGAERLVVDFQILEDNYTIVAETGEGFAQAANDETTEGSDGQFGIQTKEVASAGAITSDDDLSWSWGGTSEYHASVLIALIPASTATQVDFADSLDLTTTTSAPILNKQVDCQDSLDLTTLSSDAILFRLTNFGDVLPLTTLTSDLGLQINVDFADILPLTTLTSTPELSLGAIIDFADTLALTSLTSDAKLALLTGFADSLDITTITSSPILFRLANYSDSLDLTTLTSDPKLFRLVNYADSLDLTTLTSEPILSGLTIDFANILALTTLTSDVKVGLLTNFADALGITTLTSDAKIALFSNFTNSLDITTLTSNPALFRTVEFLNSLDITTSTSTPILEITTLVNFADTLALTTLTSDAKLALLTNFADALGITTLTSDAILFKLLNFADSLDITTLTSTPILSGFTTDFANTLALTTLTSNPKLFKLVGFDDSLDITTLTSNPNLSGLFTNFADTLNITTLTSELALVLPSEMYRWTGSTWELMGTIEI